MGRREGTFGAMMRWIDSEDSVQSAWGGGLLMKRGQRAQDMKAQTVSEHGVEGGWSSDLSSEL